MRRSLDTETTGLDLYHSARPFFVTFCDEAGDLLYWEADVDPETRLVKWSPEDLAEIRETIEDSEELILQNPKFDAQALFQLDPEIIPLWDWSKVRDTLLAGHLLASNRPHDLTSMAVQFLRLDVSEPEGVLKEIVKEARRLVRSEFPTWKIAKAGYDDMPSARDETWKYDMWLPRAVAQALGYPPEHPWWTALQTYANTDSSVTLPLYDAQKQLIEEKGLWPIYVERLKLLPIVCDMERRGIAVSTERLQKQVKEYEYESEMAGKVCKTIAAGHGYDLDLPKSGNNKSLLNYVFGPLNLPVVKKSQKTGEPSMDKDVLEEWLVTLPDRSKQATFVRSLSAKRKRDTALSYMAGYRRFGIRLQEGFFLLHPSLNPTGTNTLRWSSQSPNEQNISKKEGFNLRHSFGPLPGREWWSLDYQNIELKIPAYESGEEAMIELFEKPDDPPYFGSYHLLNASIVYPDLFWPLADQKGAFKDKYKASWYQYAKNGGFAIQYGCQETKADSTFKRPGAYRAIKEKMPRVAALNAHYVRQANRYGYVETLPDKSLGMTKGYPIYCSRSSWGDISPTIPLNYHVQSTACWALMKAMIRVDELLRKWTEQTGQGHYMILQVHDELVFDFPAGGRKNLPKIRKIQKLMEMSGEDIGIPLTTSISWHPRSWDEEVEINAQDSALLAV